MIKEIKELRIKIDGLSQLVKELQPLEYKLNNKELELANSLREDSGTLVELISKFNSKEIDKCYDALILSKAWLGKCLGELGNETPYKNDGNRKTVEDIEPTADKGETGRWMNYLNEEGFPKEPNHIEKVDWIRTQINILLEDNVWEDLNIASLEDEDYSRKGLRLYRFYSSAESFLEEARLWLGFELQRIKEDEK